MRLLLVLNLFVFSFFFNVRLRPLDATAFGTLLQDVHFNEKIYVRDKLLEGIQLTRLKIGLA